MIRLTGSTSLAAPRRGGARAGFASGRGSWGQIVRYGAATGAASVMAYTLLFVVYATGRYAIALWAAPLDEGVWITWAIGGLSMFIAGLAAALVMLIPAVLVGIATALIVAGLAGPLHTAQHPRRAATLSATVALALVLLVHLPLFQARLLSWSGLTSATYLFWLGLPSLVYLAAAIVQTQRLQPGRAVRQLPQAR